jgi:serine protease inhibitor
MEDESDEPVIEEQPPKNYYFTVDHPFIYMIIEKSTGAAIFMGRVTDLQNVD